MKSHEVKFSVAEAMGTIGPILAVGAGVVLLLHAALRMGVLPLRDAATDPDKTLLAHQSRASRSVHPARVALIGDSSCLTGIDAARLARELPKDMPAINLGLVIELRFEYYFNAARQFMTANPDQLEWLVVLVTPEKLGHPDLPALFDNLWRALDQGQPSEEPMAPLTWRGLLATELFRDRLLRPVLPKPFTGLNAAYYGFPGVFQNYLREHSGSFVDPGVYQPPRKQGSRSYVFSPEFGAASRIYRAGLPGKLKLAAGITPVPESIVSHDFRQQQQALLLEWNRYLGADLLLTNLPATLPDGFFATPAHLNQAGQTRYTGLLAKELSKAMIAPATPSGRP